MRVGVPIGDLLAGMYGAYGVAGRAARAGPHRRRQGRAHVAAGRRSSACTRSRAPATRSPARCRTGRATTTRRSAPTACSTAPTGWCRSRSAARACGAGWRRSSGCRPTSPGSPPTPSGCATATRWSRRSTRPSPTQPLADLLPRLAAVGVPAGEVRTLDRVYDWDQTRSQGLLVDVEHATAGRLTLPGPPLRFDGDDAPAPPGRRRPSASTTTSVRGLAGRGRRPPRDPAGCQAVTGRRALAKSLGRRPGSTHASAASPSAATP